jgi:hypothetical protein
MRARFVRRLGVLSIALAISIELLPAPAPGPLGGSARPAASTAARLAQARVQVQTVPPDVFAASLTAAGEIVRTAGRTTVERVPVSRAMQARHPAVPATVLRVTVTGSFPARALRYVVLAAGEPVGYGQPSRDQDAVTTVTTDRSVLTAPVAVRTRDVPSQRIPLSGTGPDLGPIAGNAAPDPVPPGPHAVIRAEYNLGDLVFQPRGLPARVELAGSVHHPTDLSGGPFPLVLFMHGNHSTCYKGNQASYEWPCRRAQGWKPLPNHAGYDYIAGNLASWGYVVVSVSANGVNYFGNAVDDTGMRQRGEVLEKHIDLWSEWSTTGGPPFGSRFVGAIDLSRIGTMGHSRGGEGVVWNVLVDRERPDPYGIDAVLALAPVDFTRVTINRVPFAVMLPTCDGDVFDLQGIHFFDDSRYAVPNDRSPKHTQTTYGANHNFFNTVWTPGGGFPGADDDGQWTNCGFRLTPFQQRWVGRVYIVTFFRRYVGGETRFDPIWTGAAAANVPARSLVSYHAGARDRRDIDRFTDPVHTGRGQLGRVLPERMSLYGWCGDEWETPCLPGQFQILDVHLSGQSFFTGERFPGLGQAILGWTGPDAVIGFGIPAPARDVSGYDSIQFRAAVNPIYPANDFVAYQNLAVTLVDGAGNRAEVAASEVGNEALAFPRQGKFILNQVRFPLEAFAGVNLNNIRRVELNLSWVDRGVIDIADLAFARSPA